MHRANTCECSRAFAQEFHKVQKHLSCLTERDDRQLYALLGLEQVKMAQEKHPEQDYGTLAALLNREKEQKE